MAVGSKYSFFSLLCVVCLLFLSPNVMAWEYDSYGNTMEQSVEIRVGADFSKKWKNGLSLSLSEDVRVGLYDKLSGVNAKDEFVDTVNGPAFNKSYTTVALAYSPIKYLKFDVGYTLRLLGGKDWSDYNEYLRHRLHIGLTGIYDTHYVKLSLRERLLCDIRTDSVNLLEKQQYEWLLRSRLAAEFYVPGKPVKPYAWIELENTLNATEYQQKDGHQYISQVRTQAGVKWRLSRRSSLDFYYRFQYGYNRDINITKRKGYIQLTEETSYLHAIGVTYNLDW